VLGAGVTLEAGVEDDVADAGAGSGTEKPGGGILYSNWIRRDPLEKGERYGY
jgi:hypothetical protein